jgi:hypothetical protein
MRNHRVAYQQFLHLELDPKSIDQILKSIVNSPGILCGLCSRISPLSGHFMNHDNITDIATYLRQFGPLLAERILETYPPMQSTKDPVAPRIATLLRKALPAQALAITGTAKYLRRAKAARIVAECGAGRPTWLWAQSMCWPMDGRVPRW